MQTPDAGAIISRRNVRAVFVKVLVVNLLLAVVKLGYGLLFGLLSMVADGLHSLLDCSANVLSTIGMTISMKPADADHPYGHRKFEALAALTISFIMFFSSYEVISEALHRFFTHGHLPRASLFGYFIISASLAANLVISTYEHKRAETLKNSLLLADAKHTLSDIFTSAAVVASLIAVQLKIPVIDLVGSLVIVVAILYGGYQIIISHMGLLVDQAAFDALAIERVVMTVPGVSGCHKIRSRGMEDCVFIDLHVQVSRHLSIEEAHDISFAVEYELKKFVGREVDVLVHVEDDNPPVRLSHHSTSLLS